MLPRVPVVPVFFFALFILLLFGFPNYMCYFLVVWFVDSSISCSSSFDVAMSTTTSTRRRHGALVPLSSISIPSGFFSRSLFISSITTPYSNTNNTPPCRSLMWISLVFPCLVLILL